jgi:hypothetical protein
MTLLFTLTLEGVIDHSSLPLVVRLLVFVLEASLLGVVSIYIDRDSDAAYNGQNLLYVSSFPIALSHLFRCIKP